MFKQTAITIINILCMSLSSPLSPSQPCLSPLRHTKTPTSPLPINLFPTPANTSYYHATVPPLAVLLITGPESDTLINSILFILGVIPSHIHGFYISLTYFNRKRKVRKGRYPGDWKAFIYSTKVQNGGASDREVRRLAKLEEGKTG